MNRPNFMSTFVSSSRPLSSFLSQPPSRFSNYSASYGSTLSSYTPSASTPDHSLSDVIEREKSTCGSFTEPIPGIRSNLTWARLRDLSTPQLTWEEERTVTDPHELYRSLLGADGSLLEALRGALKPGDVLPVDRTNEIQGLLSGWMDIREGLGLPPILDLDGVVIKVDRLNSLSCRFTIRSDLDVYNDTWNVVASFVQARPPLFKAVFAGAFIPFAITGGNGGLAPCLEGFCHYALLKMRDAVITCFAREHRELPPVTPVTKVLKMRRGRTIVLAHLASKSSDELEIEPLRDEIMDVLRTFYPDIEWTHDDITTIFNELRTVYRESYKGGKTRRKRKRRTRRRNYFRKL